MKHNLIGTTRRTFILASMMVCAVAGQGQTSVTTPDFGLIGFATANGGTTGGAGGKTITVSTDADFAAAVAVTEPLTILVSSTLDSASTVKDTVMKYAGVGQGPFAPK